MTKPLYAALIAGAIALGTAAAAEDLEFMLVNASSADLVGFYVSAADSDIWEDNLLTGGFLAPDYEIGVMISDGLTTCIYDIRGEFEDGSTAEGFGLDLCEMGEYTFTD
ncbi:MAG: hypothetical protein AAGD13_11915 [Pseudomonadota bacterium]